MKKRCLAAPHFSNEERLILVINKNITYVFDFLAHFHDH